MSLFSDFFGRKDKKNETKNLAPDEHINPLEKVEIIPGLSIPRAFSLHWPAIEKTKCEFIAISAAPADDMAMEQSKFGHYPFLPIDFDYPKDAEGRYMYPLAQINCSELPALKGYPASGYLQFYISAFDDVYGLDFDDPQSQKNFRVLYFEETEVQRYKADLSFLDEVMASDMLPVYKPHSLQFALQEEYLGINDVRYENNKEFNISDIAKQFPAVEEELEEEAYEIFQSNGHKIGGYSYFTQTDPRSYGEKFKDFILLFQIDSDDEIMWGDVGVANFFIHPDDLFKKDFSKVMYNWDCS